MTLTDIDLARQTAELEELIVEVMGRMASNPSPPMPEPVPRPGQSREAWLREVRLLREQHESLALAGTHHLPGSQRHVRLPVGRSSFHIIGEGEDAVAAQVYQPDTPGPHPALLVLHGGAWWMGGGVCCFDLNDPLCRRLCVGLDAVVVNLDYRLAPEHPYPVQLDDARAALEWMAADPAGLGIDADRLGVLGMSSGANVAASTTRTLSEGGGPRIKVHVLMMPSLDMTASSPRWQAEPEQREAAVRLRQLYLQEAVDPTDPRVSPALATDFTGLPPAVVVVATHDVLHDDGTIYAEKLAADGVPVNLHEFVMTHIGGTDEIDALMTRAIIDSTARYLA